MCCFYSAKYKWIGLVFLHKSAVVSLFLYKLPIFYTKDEIMHIHSCLCVCWMHVHSNQILKTVQLWHENLLCWSVWHLHCCYVNAPNDLFSSLENLYAPLLCLFFIFLFFHVLLRELCIMLFFCHSSWKCMNTLSAGCYNSPFTRVFPHIHYKHWLDSARLFHKSPFESVY